MNEKVCELGGRLDLFAAALDPIQYLFQKTLYLRVAYVGNDLSEVIQEFEKYVSLANKRVERVSELM